jgi:hypothetical protein
MRTLILIIVLLLPSPVFAQQLGAEWSLWTLDHGSTSGSATTRASATVRLGFPLAQARTVLQAGVTYASERDDAPSLLLLEAELGQRLLASEDGAANLFISGGVGALRFGAERQQDIIAECNRSPLCFYEGSSFQSGWRPTLSVGVGADLPISDVLMMQPTARAVALAGGSNAGSTDRTLLLRLGVGLTWRR